MRKVSEYEWAEVWADARDPNAGGASHYYQVLVPKEQMPDGDKPGFMTDIQYQHGPRNVEGSIVGALDDHILAIVQDRLEGFQAGPFACEANAKALEHIIAARAVLRERAEERRARGALSGSTKTRNRTVRR